MACLRNVCVGWMRIAEYRNMAASCRQFAAQSEKLLRLLGLASTE